MEFNLKFVSLSFGRCPRNNTMNCILQTEEGKSGLLSVITSGPSIPHSATMDKQITQIGENEYSAVAFYANLK
jgi:hypothetical protein